MHPGEATTRTVLPLASPPPASPAADPKRQPGQGRLIRLRWSIVLVLIGLVALAAVRLSFVEGIRRRVTIDGPSMAPALLGRHYDVTCGDCRFAFACDAEHLPPDGQAVCPNCGYAQNNLAAAALRPAERVLIDRWRLTWRAAQRGEMIAAQPPGTSDQFVVKRLAGLPGERLSIQAGDLYAGGRLIRKSPSELRVLRVLVHDNGYQPQRTAGLPRRWQGMASHTKWRPADAAFEIGTEQSASGPFDWLEYQHWQCTGNPLVPRSALSPIGDLDPFNQGEISRVMNPVPDVLLTCRIEANGQGQLALAAVDGGLRLDVIIEPSQRLVVQSGGMVREERRLPIGTFGRATDVEFGLCDQQLFLVAQGMTLVRLPYDRLAVGRTAPSSPLAIGARGLGLKITQLKVWRDIYYVEPRGTSGTWQAVKALGAGQVVLLGDNPHVSIDSRHWDEAGLPSQSILGRVYRPFWVD